MVLLKIDHITCKYEVFHPTKENRKVVELKELVKILEKKSNQIRNVFLCCVTPGSSFNFNRDRKPL